MMTAALCFAAIILRCSVKCYSTAAEKVSGQASLAVGRDFVFSPRLMKEETIATICDKRVIQIKVSKSEIMGESVETRKERANDSKRASSLYAKKTTHLVEQEYKVL